MPFKCNIGSILLFYYWTTDLTFFDMIKKDSFDQLLVITNDCKQLTKLPTAETI